MNDQDRHTWTDLNLPDTENGSSWTSLELPAQNRHALTGTDLRLLHKTEQKLEQAYMDQSKVP